MQRLRAFPVREIPADEFAQRLQGLRGPIKTVLSRFAVPPEDAEDHPKARCSRAAQAQRESQIRVPKTRPKEAAMKKRSQLVVPDSLVDRLKLERLAETCVDAYRDFLLCLAAQLQKTAAKTKERKLPAKTKPERVARRPR